MSAMFYRLTTVRTKQRGTTPNLFESCNTEVMTET